MLDLKRFPAWPAWVSLAAIIISALVVGLLYTDCNPIGDTITHLKFARVLADGHIFIDDPVLSMVQKKKLKTFYDEKTATYRSHPDGKKNSFILLGHPQILAGGKCPNGKFFSFVAIGYPLVLAGLIKLFGMHSAFLVNAFFVAGMLAVMAWYIYVSPLWKGKEGNGVWCALMSVVLLLIIIPEYILLWRASRESFQMMLLLLSLGLFGVEARRDHFRFWAVGLSGFLLGYAISTLEVSVILLPTFLAIAILHRQHLKPFKRLMAGTIVFVICLTIGVIPLLVQNVFTTGVWYKTPQSIPNLAYLLRPVGGRATGWNLAQFPNVSLWYWKFLVGRFTWFGLSLAAVAMVVRRRDAGFWIYLILPATIMLLFYSFYQRGHGRYFMRIAIFLTPVVITGGPALVLLCIKGVKWLIKRLNLKRYLRYGQMPQWWQETLAIVFASVIGFAGIRPIVHHATTVVAPTCLRFSETNRLKAGFEKIVPPNACILAYPYLYDILYIYVRAYSFPISAFYYDKCGRLATERLKRLLDSGIPVYYVQSPAEDNREKTHLALLKSVFDTTQTGVLAPPGPNWGRERLFYKEGCGAYRIEPLITRRTSFSMHMETGQDALLILDLGKLSKGDHTATIEIEDTMISCSPGGNFLWLPAKEKDEVVEVKITSDSLIPSHPLRAKFSPANSLVAGSDLLCLFNSEFAGIERQVNIAEGNTIISGSIKIPNWPNDSDMHAYMEVEFYGACNMEIVQPRMTFTKGGMALESTALPGEDPLRHILRYRVGPIQNTIDNYTHTGILRWTITANILEGFASSVVCNKYSLYRSRVEQ